MPDVLSFRDKNTLALLHFSWEALKVLSVCLSYGNVFNVRLALLMGF